MLRRFIPVIFAAAAASPTFAADPVRDAVSTDASKREAAVKQIQAGFGEHLRPYLAETSPESTDKLRALLEDQISVTHWARDVIKLDEKKRAAQIEWGLKPENFPLIAAAYSNSNTKQAAGLAALGKIAGDGPSFIIARFIPERNAPIYTAAIDAAWDRKPTDEIVDALWTAATRPATVTGVQRRANPQSSPQQAFAIDTLVHLKPPQLGAKIDAYLAADAPSALTRPAASRTLSAADLDRLILASPTHASLTHYAKRLSDKSVNNRVAALQELIAATGQKEEDYKLSAINEEIVGAAVTQFNKWLADHKDGKFPGVPAPAATRPAERRSAASRNAE
jgi:hypothetical protein